MNSQPRPGQTPLGAYVEARWRELGIKSQAAFAEHIKRVNGGAGVSRGSLQAWDREQDIAIQPAKLRLVARALAGDFSEESYERELNQLNQLVGRPTVESEMLDVDPDLIRELGPSGRKFIEAQIELVVRLRREVWQERGDDAGVQGDDNRDTD